MSENRKVKKAEYDVVVIGGGMAGICAALASARHGARTALVHDRHVLGGNASSEIRIHISGADQSLKQPDYAEGGLLYELMLENKKNNEQFSYSVWDMVMFEKAKEEKESFLTQSCMTVKRRMTELFPFTVYRKPRRCAISYMHRFS